MLYSRYLRWRERGGQTALFHELHPDPVYVSTVLWGDARRGPSALPPAMQDQLQTRGLLVADEAEDDAAYAATEHELLQRLDRASILYLVMAQACNFACDYCPIPGLAAEKGDVRMSAATVQTAIERWADYIRPTYAADQEYFVIFYGGEPLLNKDAVVVGIEHVKQLQQDGRLPHENVGMMISTNGVLLDADYARFLAQRGVSVAVGCDGPQAIHDAHRRNVEGGATFAAVSESIRLLIAEGVRTFASVSVTPESLDDLKSYSAFFDSLGVEKFGFNFLRGQLLFNLVPREQLADYYERAARGVMENYNHFGHRHLEVQLERKHQAFFEHRFFPTDCNGYGNQIVIDPLGNIGNCPFTGEGFGSVRQLGHDRPLSQEPTVKSWRNRLPLYNPACQPCDAKSICGGGCAWNTLEVKGDPLAIDDAVCVFTLKVFDELLWSRNDELTHRDD